MHYPNNSDNKISEINITPKKVYEKKKGHFLKGPIPMPWLIVAANLPGKALHVGIALWFWSGIKKSETFILPSNAIKDLGVSRQTCYTHLKAMEKAGLLSIEARKGKKPQITLFPHPNLSSKAN
jgi:hypothetical protein